MPKSNEGWADALDLPPELEIEPSGLGTGLPSVPAGGIAEERPVAFSFEGSYQVDMEVERESQRGLIEISRSTETTIEVTVEVAAGEVEDED